MARKHQPPHCKVQTLMSLPADQVRGKTTTGGADGAREQHAAWLLAQRGASEVYLGDGALRLLWPNGNKPKGTLDCDVIGLFRDGSACLGEGKGAKDVFHAIEQFNKVAWLLQPLGYQVKWGVIVVPTDLPFAYFDGERWTHSDPSQRKTFEERLQSLSSQDPPPSPGYCFLIEEGFQAADATPACGFAANADRYHLFTYARTGKWSAPRPLVFGPDDSRVEIMLG